jgi:hypothetical protein
MMTPVRPLPPAGRVARWGQIVRLVPAAIRALWHGRQALRAGDRDGALAAFRAATAADSRAALVDWGLWPGGRPPPDQGVRALCQRRLADWWHPDRVMAAPLAARLQAKPALHSWAARHGFATAPLLARAPGLDALDWQALPADGLVIKPARATMRAGVVLIAGGVDRMTATPVLRADLRAHVTRRWQVDGCADQEVLVEALVTETEARTRPELIIPRDIKVFAVAGLPVAVLVHDRNGAGGGQGDELTIACFDARGRRIPDLRQTYSDRTSRRPPVGTDAVVAAAARASALLPQVMRFDFYASPAGPILGEITAYPSAGQKFTAFGTRILAQLWAAWPDPALNPGRPQTVTGPDAA